MCIKVDQDRVRTLVVEAVAEVCKNSLPFKKAASIEGLLVISLDPNNVLVINMHETFSSSQKETVCMAPDDDVNMVIVDNSELAHQSCEDKESSEKSFEAAIGDNLDDGIQLTETQATYSTKYSDLDILLANDTARKRDDFDDASVQLFNSDELDNIINGKPPKDPDIDINISESSSEVVEIKQEHLVKALDNRSSDQEDAVTMITVTSSQQNEAVLKVSEMPGCSSWEESLVTMTTSLSEEQPQPEDLSTSPEKKDGAYCCQFCGKQFKSGHRLKKHKCKEVQVESLPMEPLNLISEPLNLISKPLDLTMTRIDGDDDASDTELSIIEQESFTCVCRKVFTDYELYIDHIATCNKAKLTPYKSCDICGKHFFSSSGFLKHKRLHQGTYKFHCSVCHKGFFDKTHLGAHMDSVHRKVRRYVCHVCSKSFCWKHHLKRHVTMHKDNKANDDS